MRIPTDFITVGGALDEGARQLIQTKSPRLDSELLLSHVLELSRTELHARAKTSLSKLDIGEFRRLITQRQSGIPVAYLVGWREFYGRRFWVSQNVLVPRAETELLVEQSLEILRRHGLSRPNILDLGTGSGVIAISLALELSHANVVAVDISPLALEQAHANAQFHGVENRVRFEQSDLFEHFEDGQFDLIVSNPPYVGIDFGPRPEDAVARFEPQVALYSGSHGLDLIERLVRRAPERLVEGGALLIELAPFQAERVEAWLTETGFGKTKILSDLSGLPRAVSGRWEEQC